MSRASVASSSDESNASSEKDVEKQDFLNQVFGNVGIVSKGAS